jgi:hypothetical protein
MQNFKSRRNNRQADDERSIEDRLKLKLQVGDLISPLDKSDLYDDPYFMDPEIDLPFATWDDEDVGMLLEIFEVNPDMFSRAKIVTKFGAAWTYLNYIRKI